MDKKSQESIKESIRILRIGGIIGMKGLGYFCKTGRKELTKITTAEAVIQDPRIPKQVFVIDPLPTQFLQDRYDLIVKLARELGINVIDRSFLESKPFCHICKRHYDEYDCVTGFRDGSAIFTCESCLRGGR